MNGTRAIQLGVPSSSLSRRTPYPRAVIRTASKISKERRHEVRYSGDRAGAFKSNFPELASEVPISRRSTVLCMSISFRLRRFCIESKSEGATAMHAEKAKTVARAGCPTSDMSTAT